MEGAVKCVTKGLSSTGTSCELTSMFAAPSARLRAPASSSVRCWGPKRADRARAVATVNAEGDGTQDNGEQKIADNERTCAIWPTPDLRTSDHIHNSSEAPSDGRRAAGAVLVFKRIEARD